LGYNEKSIEKGGKKGSIGKEICLNFGQFKGLKIMNTRYCVVRELHTTCNQGNRLIICKFSWSGLSLSHSTKSSPTHQEKTSLKTCETWYGETHAYFDDEGKTL
jgi:hypothetical protein